MTHTDIIEKLSKLDGPCRECDADINDALYYTHLWNSERYSLPEYTASIDAALTLVPEGWEWTVDNCLASNDEGIIYTVVFGENLEVEHKSLPIAIAIASLSAIEAMEGE